MRRLASLILTVAVLALGVAAGLWSARAAIQQGDRFAPVRLTEARTGPWTVRRDEGGPGADPYARASRARDGTLPLAPGEGLRLTARVDATGRPLIGRCRYRVTGGAVPARAWSLALHDPGGRVATNAMGRHAFTSEEVLRGEDGGFAVTVSAESASGDWLPAPEGPFVLTLRLYDAPLGAGALPDADALPRLVAEACGS